MRIRLEEDGIDKFKVVLPGKNKDLPIGEIWKKPFREKGWKTKPYFSVYAVDYESSSQIYSDSMKAARSLAVAFQRNSINWFSNNEEEQEFLWSDATD
jgi:hypothetical protein